MVAQLSKTICECNECVNDLPDMPLMFTYSQVMAQNFVDAAKMTKELSDFTPQDIKSFAALIERIKLNWAELHGYYSKSERQPNIHPLSETNTSIIHLLSYLRFMPCVPDKSLYRKLTM